MKNTTGVTVAAVVGPPRDYAIAAAFPDRVVFSASESVLLVQCSCRVHSGGATGG